MSLTQMLFNFQGRITRLQFWMYSIGLAVVFYALVFILMQATGAGSIDPATGTLPASLYAILAILYLPFLWMSLAINAKRCHDRDRSAWFILVSLIPLVGIWYLIDIGFLDGTQGPNRFGPSPKGIGGSEVSSVFS